MRKHLDYLRTSLEAHGWRIVDVEPGNDLDISETWVVALATHAGTSTVRRLAFEGMGDLAVLPVEESYACFEVERPVNSAYFSRNGSMWKQRIEDFVKSIGQPNSNEPTVVS